MNFQYLKNNKFIASAINVVGTCIYTWFMFRTILMNLSTSLYTSGGDGIKNYYAYLYHCLYGKGTKFKGMNFPFYEHVFYTDNQPLLAVPLSYLRDLFNLTMGDFIFIMNILPPLAFIFSSYIFYKLLSKLDINLYLSAFFGLLFTAMSPNLFKTFWHFGMSYSFFIVGSFYFVISYFKEQKIKYIIALFLLNFLVTFLHIYNFAISSLTILTLSIGYLIFEKELILKKIKTVFPLLVVIATSFIGSKLFLLLTDPISDRPKNPWGFLSFVTKGEDIFTSSISSLGSNFSFLFLEKNGVGLEEGYDYIGFIPSLFCIFLILNFIVIIFKKQLNIQPFVLTTFKKIILLSGVLSLLFSMGVPFVWRLESLLDYIGIIKQFRALGRFSWIFYFGISIVTLNSIDIFLKQLLIEKKKLAVLTSVVILVFFSAIEMFSYGIKFQERCDDGVKNYKGFIPEIDSIKLFNKEASIDTQFQGMIVLPFYMTGSDKNSQEGFGHIIDFSFQYALATNIPMMNSIIARCSWSQTFAMSRFVAGEYSNKNSILKLLNDKPILIVVEGNATLKNGEKYLIDHSTYFTAYKNWKFYSLNTQALVNNEMLGIEKLKQDTISTNNHSIVNHFDEISTENTLFGLGSKDVSQIEQCTLYDGILPFKNGDTVNFSVWAEVNHEDFRMPSCSINFFNANQKPTFNEFISAKEATSNDKFWFRIEHEFVVSDSTKMIKIIFNNTEKKAANFMDEFQIRLKNDKTLYKQKNKILYNNQIIHI